MPQLIKVLKHAEKGIAQPQSVGRGGSIPAPGSEALIREAIALIWRNLPSGVCTFGPCSRKCGRSLGGRGCGPCLHCAQDDLEKLIGIGPAEEYVSTVVYLRRLEREMIDPPNEKGEPLGPPENQKR